MALIIRDYSTPSGIIMIINEDVKNSASTAFSGLKMNSILVGLAQQIESIPSGSPGASDSLIDDTK